jgi:hypothetical protein
MGKSRLADIREQLVAEQKRVAEELEAARGKVKELEREFEQVEKMLSVGEKRTGKGKGHPKKKAASRGDVSEVIASVLRDLGVVPQEKLKDTVEERVVAAGFARTGFALRFKEALKEERFVDSPGGFRLADDTAEVGEEAPVSASAAR